MDYRIYEYGKGSTFGPEELEAVKTALEGETLAYGPLRDKFEAEFAEYTGVERAVSVTSATTGLHLATQLLRLGRGDEVICTPQSFRATVLPLWARGVTIRFGDICPNSLNLDPDTIEGKISDRTKAIYLVHYGGQPADMDRILPIARKHGLAVVEDCAHAAGAEHYGKKVGTMADLAVFSFHSLKNMSLGGEGGMVVINREDLVPPALQLRSMCSYGQREKKAETTIGPYPMPDNLYSDHSKDAWTDNWKEIYEFGTNLRISEIQAAIGSAQLRKLDGFCDRRRELGQYLNEHLSRIEGITVQTESPDKKHVYHLYVMFYDSEVVGAPRQDFLKILDAEKRIQIVQRYFPLHLLMESQHCGHRFGQCPVAEKVFFERQVNLPINPRMTTEDADYIIESVGDAVKTLRNRG